MTPCTLSEASKFLKMSRSNLYKRRDIPRFRLPKSRAILFDLDQLEMLLKQNQISGHGDPAMYDPHAPGERGTDIVDISSKPVYHRNARYR